ncbi:hypothetical protein [Nitratireductor pacificus]|uniref:Putative lipoprotein n=1 Tax=Nitratireductor pacificus pht-3B TaxID=391937 RepID=K2N6Q5_9HYPH|nr:hypothetical protein [Nitratireductor pacificus]EKF19858.1 putative lipoprotein [Nitratireductor pacificus pht-3B]
MINHRSLIGSFLLSAIAVVSGCQSGEPLGAFNMDKRNAQETAQVAEAAPDAVRESELRAYCPPATLRDGTSFFRTYQKGGQDDPSKIIYQASITDITRTCRYNDGSFGMTVAVAGRIVPGPVGTTGSVTMPIRIVVVQSDQVVYSQLFQHNVAITETAGATQFVFSDSNIVVPGQADRSIQVIVGYDEGPASKR